MSEHIMKIIPKDPFYKIPESTLQQAKTFLQTQIHCDCIEIEVNEAPVFVDCGANLERISCPECGSELVFEWWGEVMNKAAEDEFTSLKTEMPCCKRFVSLNDLDYDFPCGFASFSIHIFNPERSIDDKMIGTIQSILGIGVRIVEAHI